MTRLGGLAISRSRYTCNDVNRLARVGSVWIADTILLHQSYQETCRPGIAFDRFCDERLKQGLPLLNLSRDAPLSDNDGDESASSRSVLGAFEPLGLPEHPGLNLVAFGGRP